MKSGYFYVYTKDFITAFYVFAILISLLYLGIYVVYVKEVVMEVCFRYGFYRNDLLPGPFTNDRYSTPWVFLVLNNVRISGIAGLVWIFQNLNIGTKLQVVLLFFRLMWVLDLIILIAWFVMSCFQCNTGDFTNGLCDTKNLETYCQAFWPIRPELCRVGTYPLLPPKFLTKNPAFEKLLYYTLGFLLLDTLVVLFLYGVNLVVISVKKRIYLYGEDEEDYDEIAGEEEEFFDRIEPSVSPESVPPSEESRLDETAVVPKGFEESRETTISKINESPEEKI